MAIFTVKHLKAEFLVLNFLLTPALVTLELEYVVLLLLLNVMAIRDFSVKTFDVPSQGLVVEAYLLEIRGSSGYFDISVLNLTFHLLGLFMNGNTLVLAVLDLFFVLLEVALEDPNGLLLITDPVFVVSLLASDVVLKDSGAPLQVVDYLLQDLEVTLSRLVALYLLPIGVDDAVAGLIWSYAACWVCRKPTRPSERAASQG